MLIDTSQRRDGDKCTYEKEREMHALRHFADLSRR